MKSLPQLATYASLQLKLIGRPPARASGFIDGRWVDRAAEGRLHCPICFVRRCPQQPLVLTTCERLCVGVARAATDNLQPCPSRDSDARQRSCKLQQWGPASSCRFLAPYAGKPTASPLRLPPANLQRHERVRLDARCSPYRVLSQWEMQ